MATNAKSIIKRLYPMDITKRWPMKQCPQRREIITSNYENWVVTGVQPDNKCISTGSLSSIYNTPDIYYTVQNTNISAILTKTGKCIASIGSPSALFSTDVIAITTPSHTSGLYFQKKDGTCYYWNSSSAVQLSSDKNIVRIMARGEISPYCYALRIDGTCRRYNAGNLDSYIPSWGNAGNLLDVATGINKTAGLLADGTCVSSQFSISGWKDVVSLSIGSDDGIVGLKSDGTCLCTGYSSSIINTVQGWRDVVYICGCNDNVVAVKADGTCVQAGGRYTAVEKWQLAKFFAGSGLLEAKQPLNFSDKSKIAGFDIRGIEPANTSRHIAFKVNDTWNKLTISAGKASLTALATQEITADSITAEGNTVAELQTVTDCPSFVGKLVYPAVALYADDKAEVMPTFGMTVKAQIDTTVSVYSYTDYSQEYAISDGDDISIISLVAETELKGSGKVDITARIKTAGEWSEYMPLKSVQMKQASAIQLRAVYSVQNTDGSDSAKITGVIIKYNTAGSITSNNTTDIVTITQKFTNNLVYVHAYCKHKKLIDAKINAYCSIRKKPSKREQYQIGNGTGALKTYILPDKGINQDTLLVFVDGKLLVDFGYNTETSEITLTADKDSVVSVSYEYGWEMSNWLPMEQGISQINDSGNYTTEYTYTIPAHEGVYTITAVKFELARPEGQVLNETIGIGTGKRQMIILPHIARKETIICSGSWSYDYDDQRLTVIAPEGEDIVISYDWIAESPKVYAIAAGWAD